MKEKGTNVYKTSMGCSVAVGISWYMGNSIWWVIGHMFCGWAYVVYWALEYTVLKDLVVR